MPRGFYVSRARAVEAIGLLDAQTRLGTGYRFHPSLRDPKLSLYVAEERNTIPSITKMVTAWATRDLAFFRPAFLPAGDDLLVIADDLGRVATVMIVHRLNIDRGSYKYARVVYNQILWAEAGWPTGWLAHVESGNPAKEDKYIADGVASAGDTITTSGGLQARIASGATGVAADEVVMVANPLFGT